MYLIGKTVPISYLKETDEFVTRKSGSPRGRKQYTDNIPTADMRCSVVSFDHPLGKVLATEDLTPDFLRQVLEKLDASSDNYILFRGSSYLELELPQFKTKVTRVTQEQIRDTASPVIILDFDEDNVFTDILVSPHSTAEDIDPVLTRLCPFLIGKQYLIQRSGSAGLTHVIKNGKHKDYSQRLSVRVYLWLDKAYTNEELTNLLKPSFRAWRHPVSGKEWVDSAYFNRAQKTYVQYAECLGTTECHLPKDGRFYVSVGDPATIEEIKACLPEPTPSGRGVSASNDDNNQEDSIYNYDRKIVELVQELDKLGEEGQLDGVRGQKVSSLVGSVAFFNPENLPILVQEIKENSQFIFNSDEYKGEEWLDALYSYVNNNLLERISCESDIIRSSIFGRKVKQFISIDMSKEDVRIDGASLFEHMQKYKYIGLKADCGTGKTKGNIQQWVNWAKDHNKVLYYITNTESNAVKHAKDLGISHYQQYGRDKLQKQAVFDNATLLSLCYMSSTYFNNTPVFPKADVVIIDEASQVLRGWTLPEEAYEPIKAIYKLCDMADRVLLTDADYDDELCSYFLGQLAGFEAAESCLYINNAKRAEGYEVEVTESYPVLMQDLLETLDAGKRVAVFIDDNDDNKELSAFCQAVKHFTDCNYKCFDKENIPEKLDLYTKPNTTIPKWFDEGMTMLVLSPWANIGWDYFSLGDVFDKVYILDKKGYFTPKRIWQIARRMRETRHAMVLLNTKSNLPLDKPAKKLLQDFKGIDFDDLERIDQWLIKADDCLFMDNAVKLYSLVERLRGRGAIPKLVEPQDKETKEALNELYEEFDYVKRTIKKTLNDETTIDEALVLQLTTCYKKAVVSDGNVQWVYLSEEDVTARIKTLSRNQGHFSSKEASKILLAVTSSEDERIALDRKYLVDYYVIMGIVMDGFISTFFPIVPDAPNPVESFIDWYVNDTTGVWDCNFDFIDTNKDLYQKMLKFAYVNKKVLNIRGDFHTEPKRSMRQFAKNLGCNIKDDQSDYNIGAVEARNNLFKEYKNDLGLKKCKNNSAKIRYCLDKINNKKQEDRSKFELDFLRTRKGSFTLVRNKDVDVYLLKVYQKYLESRGKVLEPIYEDIG
jgi:hypothetical protein